jgi:hypothetical protein
MRGLRACRVHSMATEAGGFGLIKYGTRHYAHPLCLLVRFGWMGALDRLWPADHMIKEFARDIASLAFAGAIDDYTLATIDLRSSRSRQ